MAKVQNKSVDYGAKAKQTDAQARKQNADAVGLTDTATKEKATAATTKRAVSAGNENTTQISFRIPLEDKRALKLYAVQHDTTINEVFREMLKDFLQTHS